MKTWILGALLLAAPLSASAEEVSGTVTFAGKAPAAGKHKVTHDVPVCGQQKPDEALLVDGAGGVKNAVVSIEGVTAAAAPAAGAATLDQKGCQFLPHVQAVTVGSMLNIGNSDGVLHNVHGFREGGATLFNLAMPQPGMTIKRKLQKPGLNWFQCDAGHSWMSAYVWTFPHPYFAVTDAAGKFSIKDVPPGSYTVKLWHEGWKRKDSSSVLTEAFTLSQPLTVEAGKAAELKLQLK